jgi:hypothetical protein
MSQFKIMRKLNASFSSLCAKLFSLLIACLFSVAFLMPLQMTSALTGGNFDPGHIIDDSVFTNSSSLTSAEIQNFLNEQMPSCDTNGSQSVSYYYNSTTGDMDNHNSGSIWSTLCHMVERSASQ